MSFLWCIFSFSFIRTFHVMQWWAMQFDALMYVQPRYLLTSLALNDFAIGILITPLGILPALFHCWPYGEIFCQIQVIFTIISIFLSKLFLLEFMLKKNEFSSLFKFVRFLTEWKEGEKKQNFKRMKIKKNEIKLNTKCNI